MKLEKKKIIPLALLLSMIGTGVQAYEAEGSGGGGVVNDSDTGTTNDDNNDCPDGSSSEFGGCDSGGPSPAELDGDSIVDTISDWLSAFTSFFTGSAPGAKNADTVNSAEVTQTLGENVNTQTSNTLPAMDGGTTCDPVELYSGCKVTQVTDWDKTILPLQRKHRINQGSAWSLGAGWHSSIDSRVIMGVDISIAPEIAKMQAVVDGYDAIINEALTVISNIEHDFVDRIGYNQANAQAAITEAIATLNAEIAPIIELRDAAQAKRDALIDQKAVSDALRSQNLYAADAAYPTEFEIGVGRIKWVAPNGSRYIFNRNEDGTVSPASGNNNSMEMLADGTIKVRTPSANVFTYNPQGILTQIDSRNGQSVSITLSDSYKPSVLTDELGRSISFIYNDTRLIEVTDAFGRKTQFTYDNNQLSQVIQFDGSSQSYTYNYAAEPLAITDKIDGEGNTWSYSYREQDEQTVVDIQTDAVGNLFEYSYDFNAKAAVVTHRNNETSTYQYDDNNHTTSIGYSADGSSINYSYDDQGNRLSRTNGEGDTTSYTYNTNGEVLTSTDGAGRVTTNARDTMGRITSQTNNKGETTTFMYDSNGKVDTITKADGSVIDETWENGLLKQRIDEAGNTTNFEYDQYGYPTRIEKFGAYGTVKTILTSEYDAIGRVQWVKEGNDTLAASQWRLTQYDYTASDGRELDKPTKIIDPTGRIATYQYDLAGNVTYHKDFSGVVTDYTYTPLNKVETKTITMPSASGGASVVYHYSYTYDAEGNLTDAYHPDSVHWKYTYDGRNRLTGSEIVGTNVKRSFSYDKAGRRKTETDSAGGVTGFDYYADGQVSLVTTPLGNNQNHYYDMAGRLQSISDMSRGTDVVTYERNELGHIVSSTDGKGNTTYFGVDPLGQIDSRSLPNSYTERYHYQRDWRGNALNQSDAEQGELSYTYNAFGEVADVTDSEGATVSREYDGLGRKVYEENNTGLRTVWEYVQDSNKLTITETQTDQYRLGYADAIRISTKVYDLMGRLVSFTDAQGQRWQFSYNLQGLLAQTVNPDGGVTSRTYNDAGQMVSLRETDSQTGEVRQSVYTYDGEGRVLTEKLPYYPSGTVNAYTYNTAGQLESITYPDYSRTEYLYDMAGRRTDAYYPLGLSEHWEYDTNDNITAFTDRDGYRWEYSYDADNQLKTACDPVQGVAGCMNAVTNGYDKVGRLVSVTDANGNTRSMALNTLGNIEKSYDAYNVPVSYQLDVAGRPVVITDQLGNRTTQTFNAFGDITSITDANGYTTEFSYDKLGRLVERTDKMNASEQWAYNFRDQVTAHTDKRSNTTNSRYNQFGNLTQVAKPIGTTSYDWNAADKLTSVTNPKGHSQSFGYDALARLDSFTNEIGHTWRYDYNDLGQVTTAYQPQTGTDISYGYDGRGNMTAESYVYQGVNHTNAFNYDGAGRLQRISNAELTESYSYDSAGNLTTVNNQTLGQSFSYGYDANNRRTHSQLTNTESTEYLRDAKGRINGIQRDTGTGTEVYELYYDKLDRITQIDYPNHSRRLMSYDGEGRITQIDIEAETYQSGEWSGSWSTVEVLEYEYDANGNVTAKNRKTSHSDSDQWAYFVYDSVNRLVEADYPDNDDLEFIWDDAGNLVQKRSKTHAFTYNHNGANQITGFTGHRVTGQGCDEASECQDDAVEDPKNNWFTYQYDDNGYPISVGDSNAESTYEHDPLGRMGRVWNSDKSDMRYGYDARGRKVRTERVIVTGKNESSTVLHTAFDGRQEFAQWLDMGTSYSEFRSLTLLPQEQQDLPYGSVLHQKLYDTSHNLLKATGAEGADIANLYIHSDKLNSSILVLDSVNTQAMRMDYSPFGQTFRKHNDETNWKLNAGINANFQLGQLMPYQFTGKYTDGNSGLVLMDARWYNPHTARFLQPDYYNLRNTNLPAEIQHELMRFTKLNTDQLLNSPMEQMAFGYVKGNPLSYIDPYGLALIEVTEEKYAEYVAGLVQIVSEEPAYTDSTTGELKYGIADAKEITITYSNSTYSTTMEPPKLQNDDGGFLTNMVNGFQTFATPMQTVGSELLEQAAKDIRLETWHEVTKERRYSDAYSTDIKYDMDTDERLVVGDRVPTGDQIVVEFETRRPISVPWGEKPSNGSCPTK